MVLWFVLIIYSSHRGQAEKEFRVEVEAIGHVRHKNLVRLLGYCIEGTHRYHTLSFTHLFYEHLVYNKGKSNTVTSLLHIKCVQIDAHA